MKQQKNILIGLLCTIAIGSQFCSGKESISPVTSTTTTTTTSDAPVLPTTPYNYSPAFPAHIAAALGPNDNTPATNAITDNGATLGRVLFYDKTLSKTNTVSCASCHQPTLSFSDSAVKSKGFAGGLTKRHSMPLLNVRFYRSGKMFWDERANTLEEQVLMPIQDLTEMGLTLDELQQKVAAKSYYPALFEKAFGSTQITTDRISRALAQFVRSIVTTQSKYDQVKQGLATFTPDERDGEQLFLNAGTITCGACHTPPMFITSAPQAPFALLDPTDLGINNQNRFKSSSLRNIANTAPYFHNGTIASLDVMLSGVNGNPIPQHTIAPQDRARMLAFLQSLTDQTTLAEPRFSNPFR